MAEVQELTERNMTLELESQALDTSTLMAEVQALTERNRALESQVSDMDAFMTEFQALT